MAEPPETREAGTQNWFTIRKDGPAIVDMTPASMTWISESNLPLRVVYGHGDRGWIYDVEHSLKPMQQQGTP